MTIHLESFNGIGRSEGVVSAIGITFNFSFWVGRRVGFGLFLEFAMETFIVPCEGLLFFGH